MNGPRRDGAAVSSPIPRENDQNAHVRDKTRIEIMTKASMITDQEEKEEAWQEIRKLFDLRIRQHGQKELRPNVLRKYVELCPFPDERAWGLRLLIDKAAESPSNMQWKNAASLLCQGGVPKELHEYFLTKCGDRRYESFANRVRNWLKNFEAGRLGETKPIKEAPSPFGNDIPSFLRPTKRSPS